MQQFTHAVAVVAASLAASCSGSSSAGSPHGTDGGGDSGPSEGGMPATCSTWANRAFAQCGGAAGAAAMDECLQGETEYPPEGCGAEWEAYVACASAATESCVDGGPSGCDMQQSAYSSCETQFGVSTACIRVPVQDSKCSTTSGPPLFSFQCQSTVPAGCQALPVAGPTIVCCKAFAPM